MAHADEGGTEASEDEIGQLGSAAIKYLDDRASESFKRQIDLEESIWRSLPLFSGALIAAGAILTNMAASLEPLKGPFYVVVMLLMALSTAAFLWSGFWLWRIVRPRTFDYPADDQEIHSYALNLAHFHSAQGVSKDSLDDYVTNDLRTYMADSFSKAAKSTFTNNQMRLSARSQVLLWLLIGFLLAFVSEATILGSKLISSRSSKDDKENAAPHTIRPTQARSTSAERIPPAKSANARDS